MPHQCVHCSKIIDAGSREILEGCASCGSKFFFYIRDEQAEKMKQAKESEPVIELKKEEKERVEKDVRNILGIEDEDKPVILDLESIRSLGPGKFEIDLVSLLNRKEIVFKVEEGKYIIDLSRLGLDVGGEGE